MGVIFWNSLNFKVHGNCSNATAVNTIDKHNLICEKSKIEITGLYVQDGEDRIPSKKIEWKSFVQREGWMLGKFENNGSEILETGGST